MNKSLTHSRRNSAGPLRGRLILLVAAYAPVVAIAGLRGLPKPVAIGALALSAIGIIVWIAFLKWLPHRQPRTSIVTQATFIDAEVTGYIASILLPLVAASKPDTYDWIAYGLCAVLVLIVAFAAQLWAVNPITYALGMRAIRANVDGEQEVALVAGDIGGDGPKYVVRKLGVLLILGPTKEAPRGAGDG